MTGSPPGTVCGVWGWDMWVISAVTFLVALSKSWETSAWSLDSWEGVLGLLGFVGVLGGSCS